MAKALALEIQGSSGNFSFDVEGEWTPRIEPVYRAATNPPELERLLWTWEFRGCRVKAGTTALLWDEIVAFFARFEDRDSHPTYLRLIRDPDGAAVEELRLGAGGSYQGLRFQLIEGESDPNLPASSWGVTGTFTIVATAERLFPDGNGIVFWDQEVSVTYENGLRVLEWVTQIGTEEGAATSALELAKAYAAIDITSLPYYTYETNGPDGIEYEELDADEANSRTATLVSAVSRVREWGVAIGASGGGAAPDSVELTISTDVRVDETITTTTARATGPNSDQWVLAQKPGGTLFSSIQENQVASNGYFGRWEVRQDTGSNVASASTVTSVTVSGGGRAVRLRPIANGLPPVTQRGALLPYTAEVSVSVERRGGTGLAADLPFPGRLSSPWILDTSASKEGAPEISEFGADATQHKWKREASLVYVSPTKPNTSPATEIAGAATVTTYLLT